MALVVEDGSIVAGANSYASLAEIRAYAAERGDSLPASDADVEALAIRAMDFIESLRARFKGEKVEAEQPLQFPRSGVYVDGFRVPDDEIPRTLQYAQMAAVIEANAGDIMANPTGQGPVEQETVGPITVRYTNRPGAAPIGPSAFRKPWALLSPLLKSNGMMAVRS